jgi:hypothetical protein
MQQAIAALLATFIMLTGMNAAAQDSLVAQVAAACETDLKNFCSQVTPGEGRILHCMAAHADKISGRCEYAFYQAASILEQMAVALNYLATECASDIEANCSATAPGEGRIMACLSENDVKVSESCKTAIADTVVME